MWGGESANPAAGGNLADVTALAGISFRHESGARGEKLNPETFGPGGGWFDYDEDGRIDLLLVNGNSLRGAVNATAKHALYRNLGDGSFRDVTRTAGLDVPFYGMCFVSADVDNDGDQDVLIYGLHRSVFFLNLGDGSFRDSTKTAGLAGLEGWVGAATFFDYNRDGKLDLFVGNYVLWEPDLEEGLDCAFGGPEKKYCPVSAFQTTHPQLFRGLGDGRFVETTVAAGLSTLNGKALGVAIEDYDRDGDTDLLVANDSVPNFLLENLDGETFADRGLLSGFATDAGGAALAGMGIDTYWTPVDGTLPSTLPAPPAPVNFVRGDSNSDNKVNVADAIWIVSELFLSGPLTMCQDGADVNDDASFDVSDAVYIINFRFNDGALIPPPVECGSDPTPETNLGCDHSTCE